MIRGDEGRAPRPDTDVSHGTSWHEDARRLTAVFLRVAAGPVIARRDLMIYRRPSHCRQEFVLRVIGAGARDILDPLATIGIEITREEREQLFAEA